MSERRPQMETTGDVFGARVVALLIDLVATALVAIVIAVALITAGVGSGNETVLGLLALSVVPAVLLVQFGYFIYLEGTRGQTLGKSAMNLVVVTEDGRDIGYAEAAIRNVLRVVDQLGFVIPYLVGLLFVLLTDDSQRLGDIVADTVVVRAE